MNDLYTSIENYYKQLINFINEISFFNKIDQESLRLIRERLTLRNRFWPSELLYRLYHDLVANGSNEIYKIGAGIELLHIYTLVHDDVFDNHNSRWNLPSLKFLWGNEKAILFGDVLTSTALSIFVNSFEANNVNKLMEIIIKHWQNILFGQIKDIDLSSQSTLCYTDYIEMCKLKTSISALALEIGALISKINDEDTSSIIEFAHWTGIASQIANDFSELFRFRGFFDQYKQDKNRGNELYLGRKTIFHVFTSNNTDFQNDFKEQIIKNDLNKIIDFLTQIGAIEYAKKKHKDAIYKAGSSLNNTNLNTPLLLDYLLKANQIRLEE
jgi:geranylgeranyl pyrophosphate synthase